MEAILYLGGAPDELAEARKALAAVPDLVVREMPYTRVLEDMVILPFVFANGRRFFGLDGIRDYIRDLDRSRAVS